jgi:ribonuclease HI
LHTQLNAKIPKRQYFYGVHITSWGYSNEIAHKVFDQWNTTQEYLEDVTRQGGKCTQKKFIRQEDAEQFSKLGYLPLTYEKDTTYVWVDGSAGENCAGIGVYFGHGHAKNLSESFPLTNPTNNRAELWAIRRALEVVDHGIKIVIICDSKYACNSLTIWRNEWEKTNFKNNTIQNRDIIEPLWNLLDTYPIPVEIRWEKGHAGNTGNEQADLLARSSTRN